MLKPYLLSLLTELAPEFEAMVEFEPEYGYAGYISFSNGHRSFFRGTSFDINPQGASTIARDKAYTSYFLKQFGYRVPEELLVF